MQLLQSGQNIALTPSNPAAPSIAVHLSWAPAATFLEIDTSAFALTGRGQVRNDQDFIFYNQLLLPGGGLQRSPDGQQFTLHFDKLPAAIEKVALSLSLHQGQQRQQTFAQLQQVQAELRDAQTQAVIAVFALATAGMTETALIIGEFYRRNQTWKFRAIGQGFRGGLKSLAGHFGVDAGDDSHRPAAPLPVRLEKITLEKKGQRISLEKSDHGFAEIVVNLNWNQTHPGGGFMDRLMGSARSIDLDLGCLFQLQDGRAGAVQALGNSFGSLQQPPYIQLMGDDRTGQSAAGEFLHINGRHWEQLRRVLIYAFIYEGVPNWAAADAVVTIQPPRQPTLEVRLDSHRNDQGLCAIALLENTAGNIQVQKLVDYFPNHRVLDQAYGFGLRWVAGTKD